MAILNNVLKIRRDLLTRLIELYYNEKLASREIDRIPIEISKVVKNNERCCHHKARAVVKYKLMAIMGFGIEQEKDELDTLEHYAELLLQREEKPEKLLNIAYEACTSCVKANYFVTNLCKNCIDRSCINSCPKKAIIYSPTGQAYIDEIKCINCGICKDSCAYHAIVYRPVPCEESCPVGAISKDKNGDEQIDFNKCVYCGKCMNSCPYGAIVESTEVFEILKSINSGKPIHAIVAPAILSQFQAAPGQIINAVKKLGFTNVYEVAEGARDTTVNEAKELLHKLEDNQTFMTTSCCPAWASASKKHYKEILPYVSDTPTPMAFSAKRVKERHPGETVVFIGPCLAKRHEARNNDDVDFVLTFEELDCLFEGLKISPKDCDENTLSKEIDLFSRKYCVSGGVAGAVKTETGKNITTKLVNGYDKKQMQQLSANAREGSSDAQLVEVMFCEGGCISGPCSIATPRNAKKHFTQNITKI